MIFSELFDEHFHGHQIGIRDDETRPIRRQSNRWELLLEKPRHLLIGSIALDPFEGVRLCDPEKHAVRTRMIGQPQATGETTHKPLIANVKDRITHCGPAQRANRRSHTRPASSRHI